MLEDLHSHTYYSFCGGDSPEAVVEAAIKGGLDVIGITDHNYGISWQRIDVFQCGNVNNLRDADGYRTYRRYYDHINLVREKYQDKIKVLRGIEICTLKNDTNHALLSLPDSADVSYFDYCLIENLDSSESITGGDVVKFRERLGIPYVGIAHTDMFAFVQARGLDPLTYFKTLAENNIFWEMNVSYDSVHKYREHAYFKRFFEDETQQRIIRESGIRLSVGFDGHYLPDYLPERVKEYCRKITEMGIKLQFE